MQAASVKESSYGNQSKQSSNQQNKSKKPFSTLNPEEKKQYFRIKKQESRQKQSRQKRTQVRIKDAKSKKEERSKKDPNVKSQNPKDSNRKGTISRAALYRRVKVIKESLPSSPGQYTKVMDKVQWNLSIKTTQGTLPGGLNSTGGLYSQVKQFDLEL